MQQSCTEIVQSLQLSSLASIQANVNILRNKHLIFMGDSITRYQYIDLVYLITFQEYLIDSDTLNPVNEHTFQDWNTYYAYTNEKLSPYEKCDCFRDNSLHDERKEFENRYYHHPRYNITITYIMFTGRFDTLKGHWYDSGDVEKYREPSSYYYKEFWSGSLRSKSDWLLSLSPYPTQILVMNVGHHPQKTFSNADSAKETIQFLETKFSTFIWKTTTFAIGQDEERKTDEAICVVSTTHCLNLSWTKHLNTVCYWDDKHFYAPVYSLMNSQLIHFLESLY